MFPSVLARLALALLAAALLGACASGPADDETAGWSAQRLYGEAKDAVAAKDWTKAVKYFEQTLKSDPSRTRVLALIGDCYFQASKWNDAISRYTKALQVIFPGREIRAALLYTSGPEIYKLNG